MLENSRYKRKNNTVPFTNPRNFYPISDLLTLPIYVLPFDKNIDRWRGFTTQNASMFYTAQIDLL